MIWDLIQRTGFLKIAVVTALVAAGAFLLNWMPVNITIAGIAAFLLANACHRLSGWLDDAVAIFAAGAYFSHAFISAYGLEMFALMAFILGLAIFSAFIGSMLKHRQ